MGKKNPVVHFEMPYKDSARVAKFYEAAFGWGMQDAGPGMGGYIVAQTTTTDPQTTRPTDPGVINGGFYNLNQSQTSPEPSVVISIEDIKESIELVKKAGGEILGEPQDIPGIGIFVSFRDTEGNRVSMLQASPLM